MNANACRSEGSSRSIVVCTASDGVFRGVARHGADLYTSQRILNAEQRLLTAAARLDGASVEQTAVDLALLEMAANGHCP